MKTYQYSHLLPILDQVIADDEVKVLPELVANIEQLRPISFSKWEWPNRNPN